MMTAYDWGVANDSCDEALEMRKNYESQAEWYQACSRGDWLLWQLWQLPDGIKMRVRPALQRALKNIVSRAIYRGMWSLRYDAGAAASDWADWAERWLSGEDRSWGGADKVSDVTILSAATYCADAAAASADYTDYGVYDAADAVGVYAVYAADSADSAAAVCFVGGGAARADELAMQAVDIRREIPEWPGGERC